MRTWLIRALLALIVVSITGELAQAAKVEASTLLRHYDDGDTTVTSPSIDVDTIFNNDKMKFSAGYASDILTSASSDVRTYGSRGVNTKITDNRQEFSANFESAVPDGTMGLGYIQSDEKDYSSKIATFNGTREFFQKNTVVGLGFSSGYDVIGNAANPTFKRPMNHQVYSLSLTQVLSRVDILQLLYDFRVESGFVQSPYRRAKILGPNGTVTGENENHPRTRNRHALAAKYNYFYQPLELSLATTYRIYFDSWEVRSHTFEERLSRTFGRRFDLSLILRLYTQSRASFYRDYYTDADQLPFKTGNTTLSSYNSYLVGVRPQYNFSDKFTIYAKYEYYLQTFKDASDAGQLNTTSDDKKLSTNAQVAGFGINLKF